MKQGGVSSRVALLLRSTEPQPSLLDLSFHKKPTEPIPNVHCVLSDMSGIRDDPGGQMIVYDSVESWT